MIDFISGQMSCALRDRYCTMIEIAIILISPLSSSH